MTNALYQSHHNDSPNIFKSTVYLCIVLLENKNKKWYIFIYLFDKINQTPCFIITISLLHNSLFKKIEYNTNIRAFFNVL